MRLGVVVVLVVLACQDDQLSDSPPFVAADADADVDADTDDGPQIVGTVSYDLTVDGETVCDATISFSGDSYAGVCAKCDYVFQVLGYAERDDGNGACPFVGSLALYNNVVPYADWTALAFARQLSYDGVLYDDVLLTAYWWDYYGTYYGPYYQPLAGGPQGFGTASLTDNLLEWSIEDTFEYLHYPYYYNACDWQIYTDATGPYDEGNTLVSSLPCHAQYVDVFTFNGVAGGTAFVTVDTTGEPGLDPRLWVYGPESCVERFAADNFPCSFGDNDCASMSIDTEDARYLLIVEQDGGCTGGWDGSSEYRLDLDAEWDPNLAQIRDDLQNEGSAALAVTGSATITP